MKKFIIWFLCAIMVATGVIAFVVSGTKGLPNSVYWIADFLKLVITIPAIIWWKEKIERILSR